MGRWRGLGWVVVVSGAFACGDDSDSGGTGAASTSAASGPSSGTETTAGTTAGGSSESTSTTEAGADGSGFCVPECASSLLIVLPLGTLDFTLGIDVGTGLQFSVTCPGDEIGGNAGSHRIRCVGNQVRVEATNQSFSDSVVLTLDDGEPTTVMPDFVEVSDECFEEVVCTQGSVEFNPGSGTGTTSAGTGTGTTAG